MTENPEGVKLAKFYNTYCSKLNKSEALEAFTKTDEGMRRKRLLFVDDNSDNAWNMFEFFAHAHLGFTIFSFWFTPPATGKSEAYEEALRENIRILQEHYQRASVHLLQDPGVSAEPGATS